MNTTLSTILAYASGLPSPVQATIGLLILVALIGLVIWIAGDKIEGTLKRVLIGVVIFAAVAWAIICSLALYQAAA